ncbi:hypothetical protein MHB56_29945, partial [Paenibacillus sp. FSL H8-0315]|uniref:hypothetical protein n=1 Tax=Paenibacillus sp. FSL H8-0315 TaxID=2921384 RepID=UPI0030F94AF4
GPARNGTAAAGAGCGFGIGIAQPLSIVRDSRAEPTEDGFDRPYFGVRELPDCRSDWASGRDG